jgi:hypothetical protein
MSSPHCTDASILITSVQPVQLGSSELDRCFNYQYMDPLSFGTVGLTGPLNVSATCPNRRYDHLNTPNMDILTLIWTILYMDWTPSMGSRNPTNLSSQTY